MKKPQSLSALLTEYRDRTGESYAQIAERIGLSKARAYQLVTSEGHNPPHETLLQISHGLGIPMSALLAAVGRGGQDAGRQQRISQIIAHLDALSDETLDMAESVLAAMATHDRRR